MYLYKTVDWDSVICSIDVGSSTSSISFVYAQRNDSFKNLKDKVYRVDTWPDHKDKSLEIPSRLCYSDKKPVRYGVNATRPGRHQKWVVVESFKRHVNSLGSNDISALDRGDFDPFPDGVTLHQIYEDWVRFLFDTGSKLFRAENKIDDTVWKKRLCVFVAPNAWNEPEQANVRELLHRAGCVDNCSHVRFARESEADLHYGLFLGLDKLTQPLGLSFFVCNVGVSTGDIGFYKVANANPLHFEEVKPADSFAVGSIVDDEISAAREDDEGNGSSDDEEEDMDPVEGVLKHVTSLRNGVSEKPAFIVLEGGCGRDIRSRERISEALKPHGITVLTLSDASESELAAYGRGLPTVDGALYSCIHNFITARKAPYNYGCVASVLFNKNLREHRRRKEHGLHYISGKAYVPYAWETIVPLGQLVRDGEARTKDFTVHFRDRPTGIHAIFVVLYATKEKNPEWVFEGHGKALVPGAREICKILVNLDTDQIKVDEKLVGQRTSFSSTYTIDINFGSVTANAMVSWRRTDGSLGRESAAFGPPDDTISDWHTNDHQEGKTAEESQNTDNKQGTTGDRQGTTNSKETPQNPPPPYSDSGRAIVNSGLYTICNPRNPRGLGWACWDERRLSGAKEMRCRKNTQGTETQWVVTFDRESELFTIGPNLGSYKDWERERKPLTGYDGTAPFPSSPVLAWQTMDSANEKRWYATRAKGDDNYYIRSYPGNLAWTIAHETRPEHNSLQVSLQTFDENDPNQVWQMVLMR